MVPGFVSYTVCIFELVIIHAELLVAKLEGLVR
jgi:hypothetical protein